MTQPAGVLAPQPAVTTTVTTTAKRGGWGTDWVNRMLGPAETKPVVAAGAKVTIMQAVGHSLLEGTVGTGTGALLGAAHAKGWLDAGKVAVDGVLGLFGLAVGAAAEPFFPNFARGSRALGVAGLTTLGFRKGYKAVAGREMSAGAEGVVSVKPGEDRIAQAARDLDL